MPKKRLIPLADFEALMAASGRALNHRFATKLCSDGRFPGAKLLPVDLPPNFRSWWVPADAKDPRVKRGGRLKK